MKKMMTLLVLVVALTSCGNKPSERNDSTETKQTGPKKFEGEELNVFLKKLEKKLTQIKTLKIDFEQEKHLEILNKPGIARGQLYFKEPKSIRFEMNSPFRSVLIVDNKKVARYEWQNEQWKKINLASTEVLALVMNQIAEWLQGNFKEQSRIYKISMVEDNTKIVTLTPKPRQLLKIISRIELGLDKEESRFDTVTIHEPGGDFTLLKLLKEIRNPALDSSLFNTTASTPEAKKTP